MCRVEFGPQWPALGVAHIDDCTLCTSRAHMRAKYFQRTHTGTSSTSVSVSPARAVYRQQTWQAHCVPASSTRAHAKLAGRSSAIVFESNTLKWANEQTFSDVLPSPSSICVCVCLPTGPNCCEIYFTISNPANQLQTDIKKVLKSENVCFRNKVVMLLIFEQDLFVVRVKRGLRRGTNLTRFYI